MLKILHTADVHLGAKFVGLGEKGIEQREQVKNTFKNVIRVAIKEKVSLVLIAGDLFDSNKQSQKIIDFVVEQFKLLAEKGIQIAIIPGTHDCLDSSSIYKKFDFEKSCPNVKVFSGGGISCQGYRELDLTLYGSANLSNRSHNGPLKALKRSTSSKYHIAMVHGSFYIPDKTVADDFVFKAAEIKSSGMDYIALGHWHGMYKCSQGAVEAWYSGAPEVLAVDQKESGNVLVVSVPDSGRIVVEPKKVGRREVDEIEIDMSEIKQISELQEKILKRASPELVRTVILKGLCGTEFLVNVEELEAELAKNFFWVRIVDRSHLRLDEISEDNFPDQLIIGRFIKLMKERIEGSVKEERAVAEDVLQLGIALLQGKEVI